MYAPAFRLRAFEFISDARKFGVMRYLLEALTMANVAYLLEAKQKGIDVPLLYESGVRYLAEPEGRDEWQDIPDTLERTTGDCEDLACWRVAELRVRYGKKRTQRGITCSHYRDKHGRPVTMYHILVLHEDGSHEDPSRILGMGREHVEPRPVEQNSQHLTGHAFWTGELWRAQAGY